MTNITKQILTEDFYQTTITNEITSLGDISIDLVNPPVHPKGFIILNPGSTSNLEKVFYDSVSGNTVYIKGINRENPKTHSAGDIVQINDTADMLNYLSKNLATAFFVEKQSSLSVIVWGGPILKDNAEVSVADTPLTLSDNTTNYICYNLDTNTTYAELSEQGIVVAQVVTAGGAITSIKYRNHKISLMNLSAYMSKSVYDPSGIEGNVFLMNNMLEGADTKIMTEAERLKLEELDGLTYELKEEKGQPDGYAELDQTGKIPAAQLPPIEAISSFSELTGNARDSVDLNAELDKKIDVNADIQIKNNGPVLDLFDNSEIAGNPVDISWKIQNVLGTLEFIKDGIDKLRVLTTGFTFYISARYSDIANMGSSPEDFASKHYVDGFVKSDNSVVAGSTIVNNMIALTQVQYDGIAVPDAETFYIIVD